MNAATWQVFGGLTAVHGLWFMVAQQQIARSLEFEAKPITVMIAALAGVLARLAGQVIETSFYRAVWRAIGLRLGFGALILAIACCSLLDAASQSLVPLVESDTARLWAAPFTGFQVLPDLLASEPGLRSAFGNVGLLALARVTLTAWAQRELGAPLGPALGVTFAAMLLGRVASWWSVDLLRGVSPLP